jgi:hypothetical protein
VQGVREIFEISDAPIDIATIDGQSKGKIVIIGRFLLNKPFQESFLSVVKAA